MLDQRPILAPGLEIAACRHGRHGRHGQTMPNVSRSAAAQGFGPAINALAL